MNDKEAEEFRRKLADIQGGTQGSDRKADRREIVSSSENDEESKPMTMKYEKP